MTLINVSGIFSIKYFCVPSVKVRCGSSCRDRETVSELTSSAQRKISYVRLISLYSPLYAYCTHHTIFSPIN